MKSDEDREALHSLIQNPLMLQLQMSILAVNSITSLQNERIWNLDWGFVQRSSSWHHVQVSPTYVGLCHPWQIHTYVSAAGDPLLPGPLALCHRHRGSVQFMARKESAGVLQVCGPNWHMCEADYSCFGIGSKTAWILWLISFSGKEAVMRVSCCPG